MTESAVYGTLADIVLECTAIFDPPERLSVTEASVKYVQLHNPPAYIGPYAPDTTPYMTEPMDVFASRTQNGLVFVGGAQTAKTQGLILNTLAYTIKCNPMDVILYNPSQAAARDFSKRRIDRLHRYSKDLKAELLPGQHADNTFDKFYKSGMMFTLSWPSVNEMSGKPVPVTMLTDYDRMPMDVDGEGSPFALAQKRTTTFKSLGMTAAESSPSKDVTDPKWKPNAERPHEAPPCEGILGLYNTGDRRRWYWPCPHCSEFFEGNFSDLRWDNVSDDPLECAKTVYMMCPKNGCVIRPDCRYDMNLRGKWLKEGQKIGSDGVIVGAGLISQTASFWLKGTAAAFITWQDIVLKYLTAEREYANTGSQDLLKATVNTDQAEPYIPKGMMGNRLAEDLQSQAEAMPERKVPHDVRALFATCDVQKNRWEVQVHGIRPGAPYEIVVVDRFPIVKSNRRDDDGERLWVKPAEEPLDWDLLQSEVMEKRYELADGSGTMGIALTACDSGGKEGVTTNAYLFYKRLKAKGKEGRFVLVKGDGTPNSPRAEVKFPDSQRKDRSANARGEVPVLMFNSNMIKDALNGMLPATDLKPGEVPPPPRIHMPDWLDSNFFEELTVEVRTVKGWINQHGRRNESWDLLAYTIGLCVFRRVEHVSWDSPPSWLLPWADNPLVELREKLRPREERNTVRLADLASQLG